jgi:di/tricarboxylate transporter
MFLGFSIDAWITIATVLGLFSTLLMTRCRSDVAFLGAIGILFVTGVLDAKEAFSGFSSSSATPIGSPTHMLVYGPGGYRFSDFMRVGLPMNIIILAANIFIVNLVYPLTPLH